MQKENTYLPLVIGLSDGLVVPFAFIAGLSNTIPSSSSIIPVVLGISIFAAILMSLGGYFTIKNEVKESSSDPTIQHEQVKAFYANIGLPDSMQQQAADEILNDREVFEMESANEEMPVTRAGRSAWLIGVSYIVAALSSLAPLFFIDDSGDALKISAMITIPLLFISGFWRYKMKGQNPWLGLFQHGAIGILAATGAFIIGWMVAG